MLHTSNFLMRKLRLAPNQALHVTSNNYYNIHITMYIYLMYNIYTICKTDEAFMLGLLRLAPNYIYTTFGFLCIWGILRLAPNYYGASHNNMRLNYILRYWTILPPTLTRIKGSSQPHYMWRCGL